jgi:GSH-dependent disulfide-bond oxidoreductase
VNYEPHTIRIRSGENMQQFFNEVRVCTYSVCAYVSLAFTHTNPPTSHLPLLTQMNPTQKIPVIQDSHGVHDDCDKPITVFESGACLLYLAERYGDLIPIDLRMRYEVIEWTFWGSSELSVQCKLFGFYYKYCTHDLPYCLERACTKVKRLLAALELQLTRHGKHFIIGDAYSIADLSAWPWIWALESVYDDCFEKKFNNLVDYPHVKAWYTRCMERPASKRSLDVCAFQDMTTSGGRVGASS